MRIGSLFSGYGGLDLAVANVFGAEVAWHVECDRAPSRILAHHYPEIPNYGDVTRVDFTTIEPVDVLTGGYPCQPFSHAGMRKGTDDERHLWPHVLRAIREMGPRFAVLENVRGHLSLGFDVVLADLADIGWSAEWVVVRASDAGACHQRARLFILAYPGGDIGGERPQLPADATGAGSRRESRDFSAAPRAGAAEPAAHRRSNRDAPRSGGVAPADVSPHTHRAAGQERDLGTQGGESAPRGMDSERCDLRRTDWGRFRPAICRWEAVLGRPAPRPTESGRTGASRLAPAFVEWMMGLPEGWVTDPAIGISRSEQLKALGNGVVPQQAELALSILLPRVLQYATAEGVVA